MEKVLPGFNFSHGVTKKMESAQRNSLCDSASVWLQL